MESNEPKSKATGQSDQPSLLRLLNLKSKPPQKSEAPPAVPAANAPSLATQESAPSNAPLAATVAAPLPGSPSVEEPNPAPTKRVNRPTAAAGSAYQDETRTIKSFTIKPSLLRSVKALLWFRKSRESESRFIEGALETYIEDHSDEVEKAVRAYSRETRE